MSASAAIAAHFRIDGADLTRIARDVFLSDQPAKAWRLLKEGLGGGDCGSLATELLDGRKRLVGDERGMEFAEETLAEGAQHMKAARFVYAGRAKLAGQWLRPRAEVLDFGPHDIGGPWHPVPGAVKRRDSINREMLGAWRVGFYAGHGERVEEVRRTDGGGDRLHGGHDYTIFEPCGEPPFWWREPRDPSEALAQFFAVGRHLEQEAHSRSFPAQPHEMSPSASRAHEAFLRVIVEREETAPPPAPPPEPTLDTQDGWLSPEGKLYPCAYSGHNDLAERLGWDHVREKAGWVRLSSFEGGVHWMPVQVHEPGGLGAPPRPQEYRGLESATEEQKATIVDWCMLHGRELLDELQPEETWWTTTKSPGPPKARGCPCEKDCCATPAPRNDHECDDGCEDICEASFATDCDNCGATCCCDL